VRLVGFGFKKIHNLRIMESGLESIKARLSKGVGEDDGPTKPLKKRYARFKSKKTGRRAIRDLSLTGDLMKEIQPRYADDRQAIADASTRKGRLKARVHRQELLFSNTDQKAMLERATELFGEGTEQTLRVGRNLAKAPATGRAAIKNRRTYFGRPA
jgi:hypothetical protein